MLRSFKKTKKIILTCLISRARRLFDRYTNKYGFVIMLALYPSKLIWVLFLVLL